MNLWNSATYLAALRELEVGDLQGKRILITGASGMIGSCLVDALMNWNMTQSKPCQVTAVSRNMELAKERFEPYWNHPLFRFIERDVSEDADGFPEQIDYIIHAASNADPVHFAQEPVNTILSNVTGTNLLLNYGVSHGMKRFLYVSSGEMYGQAIEGIEAFTEGYCGPIDYKSIRSCYPSGKRAAEVLCQSYIYQYGVDAVIARPCHVFGPTMTRRDSRAVSEFLWNAAEGKDVVLRSVGMMERSHCYVLDCAQAIFCVLARGKCGEAYNIADPKYQMTVREFAQEVAKAAGRKVIYENPNKVQAAGYSKAKRAVLDASYLQTLGWMPRQNSSAIEETIKILREVS